MEKEKNKLYVADLPPPGEMGEILYLFSGDKFIATCAVRSDGKMIFSGNQGFEVKKRTAEGKYQPIETREI